MGIIDDFNRVAAQQRNQLPPPSPSTVTYLGGGSPNNFRGGEQIALRRYQGSSFQVLGGSAAAYARYQAQIRAENQARAAAAAAAAHKRAVDAQRGAFNRIKAGIKAVVKHAPTNPIGIFNDIKAGVKYATNTTYRQNVNRTVSRIGRGVGHVVTTPWRSFNNYAYQWGARNQNVKNRVTEQEAETRAANRFTKKTNDLLNAADVAFQANPNQANADAYNALLAQREAAGVNIANAFKGWKGSLDAKPFTGKFAGAADWLYHAQKNVAGFVWKYTLGQGTPKIPSLSTLPRRLADYVNNNKYAPGGAGYDIDQRFKNYSKALNDRKFLGGDELKQGRKVSRWQATYRRPELNNENFTEQLFNDPLSWAGGFGAARKVGLSSAEKAAPGLFRSVASRFGRRVAKANSFSGDVVKTKGGWKTAVTRPNSAVDSAIRFGTRLGQTAPGKAAGWLFQQKRAKSAILAEQAQKLYRQGATHARSTFAAATGKKVADYFGHLNDAEFNAVQRILNSPKKLPKNVFKDPTIDEQKVRQFVTSHMAQSDKQFAAEQRAGKKYDYAQGYLARPNTGGEGFTKRRTHLTRTLSRDEAEFAHWQRQMQHLEAIGKKPSKRFVSESGAIRSDIGDLNQASQKAYRGFKESAQRGVGHFGRAWKTSVLALSGTWIPHNFSWNTFLAAQHGSLPGALRNLVRRNLDNPKLPRELFGKSFEETTAAGKVTRQLFRPGARVENAFRRAMYEKEIARGASQASALAKVNREFFDYSKLQNWERPLNSAIPFWKWQKNLSRYAATMPFRHPFGTQAARAGQKYLVDQPYENLPDIIIPERKDEEGNVVTPAVHKKDLFKDKIHLPWTNLNDKSKWVSNAWLPTLRGQLGETNFNPAISAFQQFFSGHDKFGRKIENPWDVIGSQFPQVRPISAGVKAIRGKYLDKKWATPNLTNTKYEQGYDPSRPNYNAELDLAGKFKKALRGFFGVDSLTFDAPKFREQARFSSFMDEYLKIKHTSQATTPEEYDQIDAERKRIAGKYGYDLQKDIYDKKFRTNDTPETFIRKQKQQATRDLQQQVYGAFKEIINRPEYKGKGRDIADFIRGTRQKYFNGTFDLRRTPHPHFFPSGGYAPDGSFGSLKSGSGYGHRKSSAVNVRGKWFKSMESAARYWRYHDSGGRGRLHTPAYSAFWKRYYAEPDVGKRHDMIVQNPQFSKPPNLNTRQGLLAYAYKNFDPNDRKDFLAAHGVTNTPHTLDEWKMIRAVNSKKSQARFARDEKRYSIEPLRQASITKFRSTFTLPAQKGVPLRFGSSKKKLTGFRI